MRKFIGNCLTCACLLALAACAADGPNTTTTNEPRKPTAKVRDLSNQPQGDNRNMTAPPPH
jgi:hypothetical protein